MAEPNMMGDELSSSDEDEELAMFIATGAIALLAGRSPRIWTRNWLSQRQEVGAHAQLLQELFLEGPQETKRFLYMSLDNFQTLLNKIEGRIKRKTTRMRKAIEPGDRLAITLRFLASGESFTNLSQLFRVAINTIGGIVLETCAVIYEEFKDEYLKVPGTQEEWQSISHGFSQKQQFPNCIGALDGRHVQINSPGRRSASVNYKGHHSIILLALVDANYQIIWFSVGGNERAGDASVFRDSSLAQGLENNTLGLPPPIPLPERNLPVPYFIVGDDAFTLKPYLMKPYSSHTTGRMGQIEETTESERKKQQILDYRLSRARRLSENMFGILASRFGVLQQSMRLTPEHATPVALACVALHNFLMKNKDAQYAPPSLADREHPITHVTVDGEWRKQGNHHLLPLQRRESNTDTADAQWVREEMKEYVNAEGKVPWQDFQLSW